MSIYSEKNSVHDSHHEQTGNDAHGNGPTIEQSPPSVPKECECRDSQKTQSQDCQGNDNKSSDQISHIGVSDEIQKCNQPSTGWLGIIKLHLSHGSFRWGTLLCLSLIWIIPPLFEGDSWADVLIWSRTATQLSIFFTLPWLVLSSLILLGSANLSKDAYDKPASPISAQLTDRLFTGSSTVRLLLVIVSISLLLPAPEIGASH